MNNLEGLWEGQSFFCNKVTKKFNDKNNSDLSYQEQIDMSKDYILSLIGECKEVLDTFKWKKHRSQEVKFEKDRLIEELIDCQKFLWNLFFIWGITLDEFIDGFEKKSRIVDQRWRDEQSC